jgi:hypothetical protein
MKWQTISKKRSASAGENKAKMAAAAMAQSAAEAEM